MSQLYWDTPLLSPFLAMDHRQLKRTRSGNATDRKLKRAKALHQQEQQVQQQIQQQQAESPISSIEPALNPLYPNPNNSPVPTHIQHSGSVKSISISTKTTLQLPQEQYTAATTHTLESYENINDLLHNIHVERYGDPERRESWWTQQSEEDVEMQEEGEDEVNINNEYSRANSVLRQAFLTRRHYGKNY